jgi:hypothetical protein
MKLINFVGNHHHQQQQQARVKSSSVIFNNLYVRHRQNLAPYSNTEQVAIGSRSLLSPLFSINMTQT